jgi:uncharacterized protein
MKTNPMMKFLGLGLIVLLITACTHKSNNTDIVAGKIDSVYSKTLHESRKIWVYVPDGASDPKKKYPVVYLLDGDDHFKPLTGMIRYLSENSVCPDMIVVGIPNTDRTRDLTPTKSLLMPDGTRDENLKTSGGGENFVSFIEKELMPHIDSVYPVAPYKVLIGHSFGGLTVMNIVMNHADMFNAYVAIDPSMWWDNKKLLNKAGDVFKEKRFDGKMLFLGVANTMPGGMDTLQGRVDTTGQTSHIQSILQLKDILQNSKADGLAFNYRYYKGDDHGSVPFITEYDALHFLFSYYKMPQDVNGKLFDRSIKFDPAVAFSTHYIDISKHLGYAVLPPEEMVNGLANYYYQHANFPDRGYSLLALNLKNYPDSFNANSSMADYYLSQKNKAKAIEFYKMALKLKDDKGTRKKLDSLESGK